MALDVFAHSWSRRLFGLGALGLCPILGGCSGDLPSSTFVDKLRVLAVQAEPPEVAPDEATRLEVLAVAPELPQLDGGPPAPLSYLWLSCRIPPGASEQIPCGASGATAVKDQATLMPPPCEAAPGADLCVLGTERTARYTASRATLGEAGTGQRLITVVVSDASEGAIGCLVNAANNEARPVNPDHCVLALKRLSVSDPARTLSDGSAPVPNRNPRLRGLSLAEPGTVPLPLEDGSARYAPSPAKDPAKLVLEAVRSEDAAEEEVRLDEGGRVTGRQREALTVSWFVTAGKLEGGRSAYLPTGCVAQADCPTQLPAAAASTKWIAPTPEQQARFTLGGKVRFWAVVRDDRGGVSWLEGSALPR